MSDMNICQYCCAQNQVDVFLCTQCGAPLHPPERVGVVTRLVSFMANSSTPSALTIVDVSQWQGDINWDITKTLVHGAIIKATEGTSVVDPKFALNWQRARERNVPRGAYHFFRPQPAPSNGKKQAQFFFETMARGGFGELDLFLDVEITNGLSKQAMMDAVSKFLEEFYRLSGFEIGIYTRALFWDASLPRTDFAYYTHIHKPRPWWLAQYNSQIKSPLLPKDLSAIKQPVDWLLWQWSADGNNLGATYGMQSRSIDLNRFNGDLAAYVKRYKITTPLPPIGGTPPPQPPPPSGNHVQITVDKTNLRSEPRIDPTTDAGDLHKDAVLEKISTDGDWVAVKAYVWKNNTKEV